MRTTSIEAIVFDLDGVLIDSEPVWESVRRAFVEERRGRWLPDSQRRMMGMSTAEWSAYLAAELGVDLPPEEVAEAVIGRMADRYEDGLPLLPGAVAAVERMATGWRLALASSSPRRLIDGVLDRAGLSTSFALTISTEEVAHGKPAPDVYLTTARRLGLEARRCLAVEDSSNGLRSAHSAGLRLIAIPRAQFPPDEDALAAADLVLHSLDELTVETVASLAPESGRDETHT